MAQTKTPLEADHIYHIWSHANGNDNLFNCHEKYLYFLKKYRHYIHPYVETFAYCLMPNHFHIMIRIKMMLIQQEKPISLLILEKISIDNFQNYLTLTLKHITKCIKEKEACFRFNRKLIDNDSYMTSLIAYIHNNPSHHNFVEDINQWPYSSWHSYITNKKTNVNVKEGIDWFGNLDEFKKFHQSIILDKLQPLFE